jgi:hypothetical protein
VSYSIALARTVAEALMKVRAVEMATCVIGEQSTKKLKTVQLYFFPHGAIAPSGPGPSHYRGFTFTLRHTPHLVGLLWTSDEPDTDTST